MLLSSGTASLAECVTGAKYIQECVPEVLELKRKVWGEVDKLVGTDTILGTSTSCIGDFSPSFYPLILLLFSVPSKISDFMEHKAQFIVAHPCNPPYHTPMVELVPAPWTSTEVRVSEHFSFHFSVSHVRVRA